MGWGNQLTSAHGLGCWCCMETEGKDHKRCGAKHFLFRILYILYSHVFHLTDSVLLSLFKLDKNCMLFCHLDYVLIHTESD